MTVFPVQLTEIPVQPVSFFAIALWVYVCSRYVEKEKYRSRCSDGRITLPDGFTDVNDFIM